MSRTRILWVLVCAALAVLSACPRRDGAAPVPVPPPPTPSAADLVPREPTLAYAFRGPVRWEVSVVAGGRRQTAGLSGGAEPGMDSTLRHQLVLTEEAQPDAAGGWRVWLRVESMDLTRRVPYEKQRLTFREGKAERWVNDLPVDPEDPVLGDIVAKLPKRMLFAAPLDFLLRPDGEIPTLAEIPDSTANSIPEISLIDLLTRLHPGLPGSAPQVGLAWTEHRPVALGGGSLQHHEMKWTVQSLEGPREAQQAFLVGEGKFSLEAPYSQIPTSSTPLRSEGTLRAEVQFSLVANQLIRARYTLNSTMSALVMPDQVVLYEEEWEITRR